MPAATGKPVVGKMSSRVLNMKFMQRGTNKPTENTKQNIEESEKEEESQKPLVRDESEWKFNSNSKINSLKALKNKSLMKRVSKGPSTISQTILNERYINNDNEENNIGRKNFGKKDELDKKMDDMDDTNVSEESSKEKDLSTLFKESKELNKKTKKRKRDDDSDNNDNTKNKKNKTQK